MKTSKLLSVLLAAFIVVSQGLYAQEDKTKEVEEIQTKKEAKASTSNEMKTLFSDKDGHAVHGGFLGVTLAYSLIEDKPAIQVGGRIAWVINHSFAMGFAGNGFFNNLDKSGAYGSSDYNLVGGYGGLFFQPIFFPKSPIHVSFPIILGIGGIAVNHYEEFNRYHWDEDYNSYDYYYDSDVFLVLEPGIDIEFNMLAFMRMSVGASYRFTNNVNLLYIYNEDNIDHTIIIDPYSMNNFSFRITMLFGWF